MPSIALRFPGRRYHATPWGHHVNEGLVEWPPSPWRLVRALIATGFSKLEWNEPPAAARRLVDELASVLPTYRLPSAVGSHTRHFMPTDDPNPDKRTKVFDAFAVLEKDTEIGISWPVALSDDARALFDLLVPKLSYLGRAESVVVARVVEEQDLPEGETITADGVNAPGFEPIHLLAPLSEREYGEWLPKARDAVAEAKGTGKKLKASAAFPQDALSAITSDTAFLQKHGWTQPPGSRRVLYYRPELETAPFRTPRSPHVRHVDTALLSLSSDTRRGEVLPRMERSLRYTERLHEALVQRVDGEPCPELTGRDENGQPLRGHGHAVLIPLDLDSDGSLDHVLIHAAEGLGAVAQRALRSVRTLHMGRERLFVVVSGLGIASAFARIASQLVPEMTESRVWESVTPFVPPRHLKPRNHTLEDQVQAELASRGLPRARRIDVLPRDVLVDRGFHRFDRKRAEKKPQPPAPRFFGIRLELDEPRSGPIAIGYGAHFGLGLMRGLDR